MYEENENKLEWGPILKKIGIILAVLLVVFGIFALVSRCTKKPSEKPKDKTEYSLEAQLDEMERATLAYLTKDNLPASLNAAKTVRLKILVNSQMTEGIVDSDNTTCDTNESYSEITRLENNYAVKMTLSCGTHKESRVIYVGCFENCNGEICKGEETQTGGVCGEIVTPTDDEKKDNQDSSNNNQNDTSSTTNTNNSATSKPSTSTKPSNSGSNSSSNNTSNNGSGNVSVTVPIVTNPPLRQFVKCTQKPNCDLNANGECMVEEWVTLYGKVVKIAGPSTSYTQPAKKTPTTTAKSTTVAQKSSIPPKNTSTVTYSKYPINIKNGYYYFTRTEKVTTYVYTCDGNVKPVNGVCTYYTAGATTFGCEDKSYTYNNSNGTCTKSAKQSKIIPYTTSEVCEYTWSYQTSVPGYTPTGVTK